VDYLFIGKSGAILLGYPGTTQDVDVFPAKSTENGQRIIEALLEIGFPLDNDTQAEIIRLLKRVQTSRGMSLILITHDMALAARCDRILRIADGVLVGDERLPAALAAQ